MNALLDSLPFAVAIAFSPLPVIGAVQVLGEDGRRYAPALTLVAGCISGVVIVGASVLLLIDNIDATASRYRLTFLVQIAVGLLMLWFVFKSWRTHRKSLSGNKSSSGLMDKMMHASGFQALGLGILLAAVNPKNAVLVVGGASSIGESGVDVHSSIAALILFALLSSVGAAFPVAISIFGGKKGDVIIAKIRTVFTNYGVAITMVVCFAVAVRAFMLAIDAFRLM